MHQPKSTFFVALRQAQGDSRCHGELAEPCTNQRKFARDGYFFNSTFPDIPAIS